MNLSDIFNEVSIQMLSDFEKSRKALNHSGLKGAANEQIVKDFLRQYLPRTLDISSGTIVDSNGGVSRQLDIIIHDSAKTPIFYQSENVRVIPVECVYAVIEVKAYLDKSELEKAFDNMKSVKKLEKKAFFSPNSILIEKKTLYGKKWEDWPMQHFVFAFDSPNLDSVLTNLVELQNLLPVHKRIDSICILNKGVILNQTSDDMFRITPDLTSKNVASLTEKPLLLFYAMMSIVLNQASMKTFNIRPYLGNIRF